MADDKKAYRVLARKYRPQNFDELIGQDALVRTLRNAISSGRIAHAFMLTGVRGVGKTTTARIIAKALNYTGADGTAGPTTGPTDDCEICKAIAEDRHPDVIEMDAASRTGVDNMREILDSMRYAPTEARYKIYIIDEVHMLSKGAFNALLKTLEEPPEHVKFIFATTEIRKVPITVLSRCQRFDLRRIGFEQLCTHFKKICDLEKVQIDDEALALIARAADGSVRDGLSLLDQAMALSDDKISEQLVQGMLGLSDRAQNLDLLENALTGKLPEALAIMDEIYKNGGIADIVIQDLLELTHILTKIKAIPNIGSTAEALSADMLSRMKSLAEKLGMPTLGKTWQLLLKGLGEVSAAPNPQAAAEMVIIRLSYAADLPDPADLIKKIRKQDEAGNIAVKSSKANEQQNQAAPETVSQKAKTNYELNSLESIVSLLEENNEVLLASQIYQLAHLIRLKYISGGENPRGDLELRLEAEASPRLAQDLSKALKNITGVHWLVSICNEKGGQPTLAEKQEKRRLDEIKDALKHPAISYIMRHFPDSKIIDIDGGNGKSDKAETKTNKQSSENIEAIDVNISSKQNKETRL